MNTIRTTDNHLPTPKLLFVPLKLCLLALLCGLFLADAGAAQLGTAFTYSGRLKYKNNPADGNFDLQVKLYDDANAGNLIATYSASALPIVNGLFVMNVDFSSVSMFDGTAYWLELSARPSGNNGQYQTILPRQPVNPTPYAFFTPLAATANTANAAAANAVGGSSIQNNAVTASKIASGQVVKSLNGLFDDVTLQAGANVTLTPSGNGLSISANSGGGSGWSLTGNSGTSSANFLGTTDNNPLELRVYNERALHLEWGANNISASMNTIAGSRVNLVSNGAIGATIAGGGEEGTLIQFESPNEIRGSFSSIGGGSGNTVRYGSYATIAGGANNLAGYDVSLTGDYSSVGGGYANNAQGNYSTVPGGYYNWAPGTYSFAAGRQAKAAHNGAFVWADNSGGDYYSEQDNQFAIRAHGGVRFEDSTSLYCGSTTRQMLNLWGTDYGIGVQAAMQYCRSGGDFTWYHGGAHSDNYGDPGSGGTTLMTLTGSFLSVNGAGGELAYIGGDGVGNDVQIGSLNPNTSNVALYNATTGHYMDLFIRTLTLYGGADLAEPFEMTDDQEIPKGAVVIIDDENPGRLKISDSAYDTRVAGVISGAGGVNPGIKLKQTGIIEGHQEVALTGRVYVQADAANAPIKPGDLLTTSNTRGHAMKVVDPTQAQGAIIGKAMTKLDSGRGLVLVLVTLQ
jgi:hypothetical protein